jgi:hypothetical protein
MPLLGILAGELDGGVASALTQCLERTTPEMWLRAYCDAEEDERRRMRAAPRVARLLQQRLLKCVRAEQAAVQERAASALRETGIGLIDPQELEKLDLADLTESAAGSVAVLMVLSSCESLFEVGLTALVDGRASVRRAGAQALRKRRFPPPEELSPIIDIAEKVILDGGPITPREKRALRRTARDSARLRHLARGLDRLATSGRPLWRFWHERK